MHEQDASPLEEVRGLRLEQCLAAVVLDGRPQRPVRPCVQSRGLGSSPRQGQHAQAVVFGRADEYELVSFRPKAWIRIVAHCALSYLVALGDGVPTTQGMVECSAEKPRCRIKYLVGAADRAPEAAALHEGAHQDLGAARQEDEQQALAAPVAHVAQLLLGDRMHLAAFFFKQQCWLRPHHAMRREMHDDSLAVPNNGLCEGLSDGLCSADTDVGRYPLQLSQRLHLVLNLQGVQLVSPSPIGLADAPYKRRGIQVLQLQAPVCKYLTFVEGRHATRGGTPLPNEPWQLRLQERLCARVSIESMAKKHLVAQNPVQVEQVSAWVLAQAAASWAW
mmetsp:Transcript_10296/g.36069  ORF Transcript_10296/g.36069 Transcript_10296/m.36069 type:complete len:334 (-) Transcript_10296:3152-4153(-)